MARRWLEVLALLATLDACKGRSLERPDAAPPAASASGLDASTGALSKPLAASASAPPVSASTGSTAGAAPPLRPGTPSDACLLTRGPIQLALTGPATLVAGAGGSEGGDPRIIFNRDGVPHAVTLPLAVKLPDPPAKSGKTAEATKPERLALGEPAERAGSPGCAAAGASLFCLDRAGAVHRFGLTGEGSTPMAQARAGTAVAAATLAGAHVVYAFLADRRTSEGTTTLAFAAVDDAPPVLLSEEGSGATSVMLASRGEDALAMYIDARRALTPVHARVLTFTGKLNLGPDAVVFVGGGTDGRTPCALAQGSQGHALALLPIEKDEKECGMATIRIEEQPRDDAPVTWSLYPATMERPAIAATQGVWPIRVLRSRPLDADQKGRKVLELGELDAAGVFKALCPVAEGAIFADLAMLADPAGALWIAYTDADGTWLEKRGR
jgi:hypothetical protein